MVTVTVKVVGLPLVRTMGLATEQTVVDGAPEHVMVTPPEYPGPGVSCKEYCAVWPAFTVAVEADGALVTVKAAAVTVPLTMTDCGEVAASSVSVTVSVRAAEPMAAVGAKPTTMVQLAAGATAAVQELAGFTNSFRFAPVKVTAVIWRGAEPVLVTVIF